MKNVRQGGRSSKRIFKLVDNTLQNVTYPTPGSKMIPKYLEIWSKYQHSIILQQLFLCICVLPYCHFWPHGLNSPSLHELCSIINRHIMRISCICVIAACARILAAAPWENAATLSCCLPYQIHTMDSKPASTCFSIFYKYKDKYKHKDKFKYTNQNNGQLCSYYVFF